MTRGGARPGAGQPPVAGIPRRERIELKMTEAERAEIEGAVPKDKDRGPWIIEAALMRARSDRLAERLVCALHIYPNYRVDSRGPSGCIMDALETIAPGIAAELREQPADEVYARHWGEDGILQETANREDQ